jgi:hypothetical protein
LEVVEAIIEVVEAIMEVVEAIHDVVGAVSTADTGPSVRLLWVKGAPVLSFSRQVSIRRGERRRGNNRVGLSRS